MATAIGVIKTVIGSVIATSVDGTQRNLQVGDQLFPNEIITTSAAGAVEIELADGSIMDLGRSSQALLDNEVFDPQQVNQTQEDIAAEQQALLEGADPTQILDPTAAGTEETTGEEGHSPVRVDFIAPTTPVTSGFETTGPSINLPESSNEVFQAIVLDDVVVALSATPQITEDDNVITYTATLSQAAVNAMTVTLSNGGVITILGGELTGNIEFPVTPDSDVYKEADETIDVNIATTSGGGFGEVTLPSIPSTTTIVDSIDTVVAEIEGDTEVIEGEEASYTIKLVDSDGNPVIANEATIVTVRYTNTTTQNGDTEYNHGETISVTIAPGSSEANFTVQTEDDLDVDNGEQYQLEIITVNDNNHFENVTIDTTSVTTTIIDNDVQPTISVNDVTVNEDDGTMTFTVELSHATGSNVTFDYATADIIPVADAEAGLDYTATSGSGTILATQLSTTITVAITDDYLYEVREQFNINLSNLSGNIAATGNDLQGVGTIEDEAVPGSEDTVYAVISAPADTTEGAVTGNFTVQLLDENGVAVVVTQDTDVTVSFGGGSAEPGDYIATTQVVTILAGSSTTTLTVQTNEDVDFDNETFTATITDVEDNSEFEAIDYTSGIAGQTPTADATILDNDVQPTISVNDVTVNEDAGTMTFTVELSHATGSNVTFDYATADIIPTDAEAGLDYTATSGSGTILATQLSTTITVAITDDYLYEISENFHINLSNLSGNVAATGNDLQGVGTIEDEAVPGDDDTVYITLTGETNVNEGDTGIEYTVHLLDINGDPVVVTVDTVVTVTFTNGSTDNDDTNYNDGNTISVTVLANNPTATFTVDTQDDYLTDNNEDYQLEITAIATTEFENVDISGFTDSSSVVHENKVTTTIHDDTGNPNTLDEDPSDDPEDDHELVQIKLVAADSSGNALLDSSGNYVLAETVEEGSSAYYIALAFEPGADTINPDHLIDSDGTVTVKFWDGSATGSVVQTAIDGSQDYNNIGQTVTIGQMFSAATFDDYLSEGDHNFLVTINPESYSPSGTATSYENVTILPNGVVTTITDDADDEVVDEPIDTVYVQITGNSSVVEGNALTHTVTLVDKDGTVLTVPIGKSITVTLAYSLDGTNSLDYAASRSTSVTINGGSSSTNINNLTIDDFTAEGNEGYTLTITGVTDNDGVYENIAISTVANGASQNAASVTGTIRDGVTLGVPTNGSVDEDTFDATNSASVISDTQSLNITAPTDDNAYTLSFDGVPSFQSDIALAGSTGLTSNGTVIEYVVSGDTVTAYSGAGRTFADRVFEIVLNKNAAGGSDDNYTYTQFKNIDHPTTGDATTSTNDDDVVLTFSYKITDGTAESSTQTFTVTVNDSVPDAGIQSLDAVEDQNLVITISQESFNSGTITVSNGVDVSDQDLAVNGTLNIYDIDSDDIVGVVTNNGDGTLTFRAIENYSGDTKGFTFKSIDNDGDFATGSVDINVIPSADKATFDANLETIKEDTAITIGFNAPQVGDSIDENGATAGDYSEALGLIRIFNVANDVEILKGDGSLLWTSTGLTEKYFILLSDGSHTEDAKDLYTLNSGDAHYHTMTTIELEALQINPVAESHFNMRIVMSVNEYEVDATNHQLLNSEVAGNNGRYQARNYRFHVEAVTDEVDIEFDDNQNSAGVVIGTISNSSADVEDQNDTITLTPVTEDSAGTLIDLKLLLNKTSGTNADTTPDLDGSEHRSYTISGIPEGSIVTLGSAIAVANASGFATINFPDNTDADPEFSLQIAPQYSGTVNAVITINVTDVDSDSPSANPLTESDTVYLNIEVTPVVDQVTISASQGRGFEDAGRSSGNSSSDPAIASVINDIAGAIDLDVNVTSDDKDGSETYNVTISTIPVNAAIYYNGVELAQSPVGTITINDFDNAKALKIVPAHNSDADFDLNIEAVAVESNGVTSTTQQLTMNVQVQGVADVPVNDALNSVDVNGQAYQVVVAEDSAGSGAIINFSDIYQGSGLAPYDDDGSEVLSIIVTGLEAEFNLDGATFMGGVGAARKWVFDSTDVGSITLSTRQNYSGEIDFTVKYVTTEQEGDSKTHADVPVKILVTPEVEAEINLTTSVLEDVVTTVNFGVAYQNGDLNEVIETVFIKVSDVQGQDFTLFVSGTAIGSAGLVIESGFYKLTGPNINNVTVQYDADLGSSTDTSFGIKYITKDSAASVDDVSGETSATYTLSLSAVTDDITVAHTIDDAANPDISVSGTDVTVNTQTTINIDLAISGVDTASEANGIDIDGSEYITRFMIEGVPDGVRVQGGLYGGNTDGGDTSTWYLDIVDIVQNNSTENYTLNLIIDGAATTYVKASSTIKITAYNQDGNASEQNGVTTFTLIKDASFTDTNDRVGTETGIDIDNTNGFIVKSFTPNEDTPFTVADFVDVDVSGSGNFAITIEGLTHATLQGLDGVTVTTLTIGGEAVYNLVGTGTQTDIEALLANIQITPDANFNSNNLAGDELGFKATLTTYGTGGNEEDMTASISTPVTPVTDVVTLSETLTYVDENGAVSAEPLEDGTYSISINPSTVDDLGATGADGTDFEFVQNSSGDPIVWVDITLSGIGGTLSWGTAVSVVFAGGTTPPPIAVPFDKIGFTHICTSR